MLALPSEGVIGGHYAALPEIRGADTVRWTILLDRPLVVSHQILAPAFDTGDIVRRAPVPVRRGDTILGLRAKCQAEHAAGCLEIVDTLASGELSREAQLPESGSYFRPMGRYLRQRTDAILATARYHHYAQ
jgi:methionyl-tRNA formyltransferase